MPSFLLNGVVRQRASSGPVVVRGYTRLGGQRVGTFLRKRPIPGMAPTFSSRLSAKARGSVWATRTNDPTLRAQDFLYSGKRSTRHGGQVTHYSAQRVSSLGHRSVGLKYDALDPQGGRMRTYALTNRSARVGSASGGFSPAGGRAYYNVTPSSQRRIIGLASRMRVAAGGRPF